MFMKTNRLYDRMSLKRRTLAPSMSGYVNVDNFYYNKQTEVELL